MSNTDSIKCKKTVVVIFTKKFILRNDSGYWLSSSNCNKKTYRSIKEYNGLLKILFQYSRYKCDDTVKNILLKIKQRPNTNGESKKLLELLNKLNDNNNTSDDYSDTISNIVKILPDEDLFFVNDGEAPEELRGNILFNDNYSDCHILAIPCCNGKQLNLENLEEALIATIGQVYPNPEELVLFIHGSDLIDEPPVKHRIIPDKPYKVTSVVFHHEPTNPVNRLLHSEIKTDNGSPSTIMPLITNCVRAVELLPKLRELIDSYPEIKKGNGNKEDKSKDNPNDNQTQIEDLAFLNSIVSLESEHTDEAFQKMELIGKENTNDTQKSNESSDDQNNDISKKKRILEAILDLKPKREGNVQ